MRILVVTAWFPPHHFGGYEVSCRDTSLRLVARGHDVHVLCGDERLADAGPPTALEPSVRRELPLHVVGGELRTTSWPERFRLERVARAALVRALDEVIPDVVAVWHLGGLPVSLVTTLVARAAPLIYVVADDWPTYAHRLDPVARPVVGRWGRGSVAAAVAAVAGVPGPPRTLGDAATCVISAATLERCQAASPWPLPRPTVVRHGIDGTRWAATGAAMATLRDRPWRGELLYVGRFDDRKGCLTLLDALAVLPGVRCRFDGRAAEGDRRRLLARAEAAGVVDRVVVATSGADELAAAYAAADCVVFPSEWPEPFGLVALEAMACGTPVVATRVGGSAEFLRDGVNVLAARPGDATDLAAAIAFAAALAPEARAALVANGRATAGELDVERTTDDLEAWLTAAADGFKGPLPAARKVVSASLAPLPGLVRPRTVVAPANAVDPPVNPPEGDS